MEFDREPTELLAFTVQRMLAVHGLETPSDDSVRIGNAEYYWTNDDTMGVTYADTDHELTFTFEPSDPDINQGSIEHPSGQEDIVHPENTTAYAEYLLKLISGN